MYIADLHIHSRYSRATSRDCTPEYLDLWARRKGIGLIGTGDFTHPAWREELEEKLEPTGDGFYRLKEEYRIRDGSVAGGQEPRFVVTGEISSIYKKNGEDTQGPQPDPASRAGGGQDCIRETGDHWQHPF